MKLWLSRIQLSPYSREAIRLAADPNRTHGMICALFSGREAGRVLFRVDADAGGPVVLVQSGVAPDLASLPLDSRDLRAAPASKEVELEVGTGTELAFRLLARPVRRTSTGKGNKPGPRRDVRTDEERLEWLKRKAEQSGFVVTGCGLTILTMASVHSSVGFRAKGGSFSAVRFDGTLVVTDPVLFQATIQNGVGTQKGFGLGMLSLGRV